MTTSTMPVKRLENYLYIEPMSACNLKCKMCYSNVINGKDRIVVEAAPLLDFARRFLDANPGRNSIYWCGSGEVFMHRDFPYMVNTLSAEYGGDLTHIIQTNGTLQRLHEFDSLANVGLQVSIDGLRKYHDWHRGEGTYEKSIEFCRQAVDLGCQAITIRMLLTRDNMLSVDEFFAELRERISPEVDLSVIRPWTNQSLNNASRVSLAIAQKEFEDDRAVTLGEARKIMAEKYQNRYPIEADHVINYLSLTPFGVHNCCNSIVKLGNIGDDIGKLTRNLVDSETACRACPVFPCV